MPRKGIISTDQDALPDKEVPVYYCLCGHLALISETAIQEMPKRKTDGAAFFDGAKIKHSLTMANDDIIVVRRGTKGIEVQHCLKCKSCGLPLAYQVDPKSKHYFLRRGGLLRPGETSELVKSLGSLEELQLIQQKKAKEVLQGENNREPQSKSVASSLLAAQFALDEEAASHSYEADAREIYRIMGKKTAIGKRQQPGNEEARALAKRKGTLLDQ